MIAAAAEVPVASAAMVGLAVAGRYLVSVDASDSNSGVANMQITADAASPGPVLAYAADTIYRGSVAPRWVRVQDRAGNLSAWRAIAGKPTLAALKVSPSKFTLTGRRVKGRCVATTRANHRNRGCIRAISLRVSYTLSLSSRVTFTIKMEAPGRSVKGQCVAPSRKNQKQRRCTRMIALRGTLERTGKAGTNSFTFDGRIGGRRLAPGSYRLSAIPSANGRTGNAQNVSFQIRG